MLNRMRGIVLAAAALLCVAAGIAAASPHGGSPHHRPPHHRPPYDMAPYWFRPSAGIWINIDLGTPRPSEEHRPEPYRGDGAVTVVPATLAGWEASMDVAMNTFAMSAPFTLPESIVSKDVASIRAIFNDKVDRSSVAVVADEDFSRLWINGAAERFASLSRAELMQIVLERADGYTLVQDLSIGLGRLLDM